MLLQPKRRKPHTSQTRRGFNYPSNLHGITALDSESSRVYLGREWVVDRTCVRVGSGRRAFAAAEAALRRWAHFQLPWAFVDAATPLAPGSGVCVVARTSTPDTPLGSLGIWSRNPLQVVFVSTAPRAGCRKRLAYAHGTLDGHLLARGDAFAPSCLLPRPAVC